MESAVWGFIGTLVGAIASIATVWISNNHAVSLQRSASDIDREERRRAFQRDTLLSLQDALHDELRLVTRVYLADKRSFANSGEWGTQLLDDELNESTRLAGRKALILLDRVTDDELRRDVANLRSAMSNLTLANSAKSAETLFRDITERAPITMKQIGKGLRSQY
ncbi:hypothetical protein [Rivibacter subsaxonicus]|uniref:Uncharacterized protein n=1 Tax=Rivibacter subsaxonicus TaxID=457575 RepID=A0A4Q7VZV8_9BURK|nr:hypothetical protein [Rivibacter subsaxonicus]RZU02472.1 hypothetical protein EV670_0496 [Rivibacter subsaxonicus]